MTPLLAMITSSKYKYFSRALFLVFMAFIHLLVYASPVQALSSEQRDIISAGILYYDINPPLPNCGPPASGGSIQGNNVYMLGDSITAGGEADLTREFTEKGLVIGKINGIVGRAISAPGQGSETGLQAITNDSAAITSADAIIIELGTNATGANAQGIKDMISGIKAIKKPTANVFWVNIFSKVSNKDSFNQILSDNYIEQGYTVIDTTTAGIELSTDDVHPNANGYATFASTVVGALASRSDSANSSTANSAGCTCSANSPAIGLASQEENYQNTWSYFTVNKGLSAEATAGIMGNLEAESGINPWNTQNNAVDSNGNPVPDGPEIPIDLIRSNYGYGIAQWTSAGRQQNLVDYANNSSPKRSTGDLGLQLDFLWQELTTSYASVLAKLQTPGVTLEDASDEVLLRFETPQSVLPPPRGTPESKQRTIEERRGLGAKIYNTYSGKPAGSYSSSACASTGDGNVVIDLDTVDTSSIPCAPNTTDGEISDAYNGGKEYIIRLCNVGGVKVNSQISGPIKNMLDKANADGVALGIGEGYRDMDGQISIYTSLCSRAGIQPTPAPYPKASRDDYVSCPGGAPPGYSNHQMGLSFDMTCNGQIIPQSYSAAQSNSCYTWLTQNAQSYGLFEWGKGADRTKAGYEAWHWSVDGS